MKLVITIPAYNEAATVAAVIKGIPGRLQGIEAIETILIDDGSTDGTAAKAAEAGVDQVISHQGNRGLGISFRDGIDAALERGADIIVNLDADGQNDAGQIPGLVQPILEGKADIVLGWRDIDNLDFMPGTRKLGNKFATWLTNRLSGLHLKDSQTGFRAFSREAALRLHLFNSFTYVQETLIQAGHKGLKVAEVPIEVRAREGTSRLIGNLWAYAGRAGAIILTTYRDYHPLKFFSAIGVPLILLGLGFGLRVLVHFFRTGLVTPYLPSAVLASLLIIVGSGAIVMGIFAQLLNRQRRLSEEILYRLKKSESSRN